MLHELVPHSGHLPKLLTPFVLPCVVMSLTSAVNAQVATLTPVNLPTKITVCEPVNLTWSGGTAPYWMYVFGALDSNRLMAQNTTGIPTTWFVWIPDIPAVAGSTLRFEIGDSATHSSVSLSELVGSESSSCLGSAAAAVATTPSSTMITSLSQPTPSPSTNIATTPPSSPLTTTSLFNPIPARRGDGLSRAAVAGIAAATTFVGIALVVLAWFTMVSARRKSRARKLEPGQAGTEASPYPCPTTTATGGPTSRVPLSIPPTHVDSDSRGYSVMADVGGPQGASPVSQGAELATDRPPSPTGNLGSPQPEALLLRIPHPEPGRKRGRVPVEPCPHEPAESRVELYRTTPLAVGDSDGMRTSHGVPELEPDVRRSIGRVEVSGWEVMSPSEGTALPPYAP